MSDELAPMRGIVFGLIISAILWVLIIGVAYLMFSAGSVMHELGRRAVEEGVIR